MFIFTALQLLHYLNLLTLTTPLTPVPPELSSRDAHNMPCALRKPHCNGRVLTVTVIETIYYTITVSPTGPSASVAEDVVVVELPDVEIVEEKTEKVEEGDGVSWQRCEEYGLCDEL